MKRKIIIIALALMLVLLPCIAIAQTTVDGDIGGITGFGTPPLRHSFFAEGLLWSTYVDTSATDWVYRTSDDYGATWSGETVISNNPDTGQRVSLYFDGTYVHLVRCQVWDVYYRRAIPESDGTLAYSAAWQMAVDGVGLTILPSVAPDTNGYPFIAFKTNYGAPAHKIRVVSSDANDGTWPVENSNLHDLLGGADVYCPLIVPMASGRMLALYADGGTTLKGQMWSGSAWGAADAGTSDLQHYYYSAVNVDDTVHIVFTQETTEDLIYTTYTSGASDFGSETVIDDSGTGAGVKSGVLTINIDNNDMYVFTQECPTADHVYYIKYDAGATTWESAVDWIDESIIDGLPSSEIFHDTNYTTEGGVAYFYLADPQHLKIKGLDTLEISTLSPSAVTSTSATLRGEIISLGTGAITTRGFQYGLTETPTWTESESGSFGVGVFGLTATDLEADTIYYVRAYGISSVGTVYGEWIAFLTAQQGSDQPDDPDDGMLPPVPTSAPGGWIIDDKTYDTWPFSDLINTFADMVSRSFVWFLLTVATIVGIGLLITRYTRHLGIVFLTLGVVLGIFISGQYLDWWIIFPYLIVGIALVIKEQNVGIGF